MLNPAAGVGAALAFTLMDKQVVLTQEVRDYPMIFFDHDRHRAVLRALAARSGAWQCVSDSSLASMFGLYLHYYCYMVNIAILLHALITLRDRAAGSILSPSTP